MIFGIINLLFDNQFETFFINLYKAKSKILQKLKLFILINWHIYIILVTLK